MKNVWDEMVQSFKKVKKYFKIILFIYTGGEILYFLLDLIIGIEKF